MRHGPVIQYITREDEIDNQQSTKQPTNQVESNDKEIDTLINDQHKSFRMNRIIIRKLWNWFVSDRIIQCKTVLCLRTCASLQEKWQMLRHKSKTKHSTAKTVYIQYNTRQASCRGFLFCRYNFSISTKLIQTEPNRTEHYKTFVIHSLYTIYLCVCVCLSYHWKKRPSILSVKRYRINIDALVLFHFMFIFEMTFDTFFRDSIYQMHFSLSYFGLWMNRIDSVDLEFSTGYQILCFCPNQTMPFVFISPGLIEYQVRAATNVRRYTHKTQNRHKISIQHAEPECR